MVVIPILVAGGCTEDGQPVEPVLQHAADYIDLSGGWDLPLLSAEQLARSVPAQPCADAKHHEFDFWVGEWNVTTVNGAPSGTNIVTSELDGCLVQEHWTAGNGSRGLSLNTYDRETDQWYQTWASQAPQAVFGRLRTAGGIVNGKMVLTGERNAAAGFTFLDDWTWELNAQGQVIQSASAAVPPLNFLATFTGVYTRQPVTPAPPLITPFCQAGAVGGETRQADFLTGSWKVTAESGLVLGSSQIETDLTDCLFIERFESRGGLRAISFTYVDLWVERWYRTYVDSEGERLELEGGFENGALVLRGTEPSATGPVEVAITWQPEGANVRQTWEISRDGGQTWKRTAALLYSPQ